MFWLILLFSNLLWADYYLIHNPDQVLAAQDDYLATKTNLYKKIAGYYENVFTFPEAIDRAEIKNKTIYSDNYVFHIKANKITWQNSNYKPNNKNTYNNRDFWLKTKLNKYYITINNKLVFNFGNIFYLGNINNELITDAIHSGKSGFTTEWTDQNRDGIPELSIKYQNQTKLYEKIGNVWQEAMFISSQPLDPLKLNKLSADDLEILRCQIAARHGKIFKNTKIQEYFQAQPWYKPDKKYNNKRLNNIEIANIRLLYQIENMKRREKLQTIQEIQI